MLSSKNEMLKRVPVTSLQEQTARKQIFIADHNHLPGEEGHEDEKDDGQQLEQGRDPSLHSKLSTQTHHSRD